MRLCRLFALLLNSSVCVVNVSSWTPTPCTSTRFPVVAPSFRIARPSPSRHAAIDKDTVVPLVLRAAKKPINVDSDNTSTRRGEASSSSSSMNPLTKASWFGVEAFGRVFGSKKKSDDGTAVVTYSLTEPPLSFRETLARLQADNDREYFLSGQVDELIYDPNCVFADPFVEFKGRDRFVQNLANLGSFITKYSARPLEYQVNDNAVETKFMVKLQLNLPWEPVLAWPWGVRCEIDEQTNLVVLHKESWDIEPWEGIKQIFRKPTVQV